MRILRHLLLTVSVITVCLSSTSCSVAYVRNYIWPWNKINSIYESPNLKSYKLKSVSILPIIPDDTTDTGTFYSTNHLINSLEAEYPDVKFQISMIDTAIAIDSFAVIKVGNSLKRSGVLDLETFTNSELGYDVLKDSPDAMLIGLIDSCKAKKGVLVSNFKKQTTRILSCNYSYYLVSLKDGRVIWKAQIQGEAGYLYEGYDEIYPPLDEALSNGIDLIVSRMPFD